MDCFEGLHIYERTKSQAKCQWCNSTAMSWLGVFSFYISYISYCWWLCMNATHTCTQTTVHTFPWWNQTHQYPIHFSNCHCHKPCQILSLTNMCPDSSLNPLNLAEVCWGHYIDYFTLKTCQCLRWLLLEMSDPRTKIIRNWQPVSGLM